MLKKLTLRLWLIAALGLVACSPVALPSPAAPGGPSDPKPSPAASMPLPPSPSPDEGVSSSPDQPMNNPTPADQPFAPQPDDARLIAGNAFLDSTELLAAESFPVQYTLRLQGSLPTPCHQLRVKVSPPDASKNVAVDVYSVVDGDMVCAQVLKAFDASVPLGTAVPVTNGPYQLLVNGEPVGELK